MEFTKEKTNVAKGIAICLMFAHHVYTGYSDRFLHGNSYVPFIPFFHVEHYLWRIGNICVSMFLFLSGYGMFLGYIHSQQSPTRYSLAKLKNFYLTYWIYFLCFVPFGFIFFKNQTLWNSEQLRYSGDITTFLMNFIGWSSTYNEEWWFVRIFVFTLLFLCPLYIKLAENNIVWIIFTSLFLFSLSSTVNPYNSAFNFALWQTSFAVGIICAKLKLFSSHPIRRLDKSGWIWILSGLLLCVIIGLILRSPFGIKFDFLIAPFFIYFSVRAVAILHLDKLFTYLGQYAFPLWLIHSFFCYYYLQDFIYSPKWSPLIFLLLTAMSLLSVLGIEQFGKFIKNSLRVKLL